MFNPFRGRPSKYSLSTSQSRPKECFKLFLQAMGRPPNVQTLQGQAQQMFTFYQPGQTQQMFKPFLPARVRPSKCSNTFYQPRAAQRMFKNCLSAKGKPSEFSNTFYQPGAGLVNDHCDILVWDGISHNNPRLIIQKKTVRLMAGLEWRESCNGTFKNIPLLMAVNIYLYTIGGLSCCLEEHTTKWCCPNV